MGPIFYGMEIAGVILDGGDSGPSSSGTSPKWTRRKNVNYITTTQYGIVQTAGAEEPAP